MLKVIFSDPLEFLKKNYKSYDAIIFPDFIIQRNFEISLLQDNEIKEIPANIYTLFTLAKEISGQNISILPRFLERQIAHLSITGLNYFRDLHENEHFITELLSEYWEIKENFLSVNNALLESKFYELFDSNFSKIMDKLESGINVENRIMYFYPKIKIIEIIKNNIEGKNFKNILFCCFYYIGPELKKFIDYFKNKYNINFLIQPLDSETSEVFLKRIDPDDIESEEISIPEEIVLESLPDERREIKYIANFILNKIHQGYKFSDFIIAFPDAKQYDNFIEEIFSDYSIPYFQESRVKLIELPLSNALIENLGKNAENNDLEKFVDICFDILMNITNENNKEEFLLGMDKLVRGINEFKNEMKILRPYLNESYIDYRDFLISFLATSTFGRNLENLNAVQIIDMGNISLRKPKYTIIGGMRDGYFPRPYQNNIIFTEIYNKNELYYKNQYLHEKSEFYRFISSISSSKKILITYPYLDIDGKRYLESYFIKKFEKEFNLNIKRETHTASSLVFGDVAYSKKDLDISLAVQGVLPSNKEIKINCNDSVKEKIVKMELTPSHITTYNACPRKFYFRYILELEVPVKPFSPPHMGTIIHDILKEFYSKHQNLSELQKLLNNREISLKKEIEDIINKMSISNDREFLIHLETIKRDAIKSIKNDLNIDPNRNVLEREKEFSMYFSGTKITGRIDRIDRVENTYVLMDYKYSSLSHVRGLFIADENDMKKGERDLSLPIYILWLEKNFNPQSFVAFYFPIRTKFRKQKKWLYLYTKNFRARTPGWVNYIKNNVWNDTFKSVIEKRITEIINGIKNCEFPLTDQENICQNCEFRFLCRGDFI